MDQVSFPRPKLVTRNAAKNFDYTPSASRPPSTSGSSAPRTRSPDFEIEGIFSEIDSIFQSLGLNQTATYEAMIPMKNRLSSDIAIRPKKGQLHFQEEVPKSDDPLPHRHGDDVQKEEVIEIDHGGNKIKPLYTAVNSGVRPNGVSKFHISQWEKGVVLGRGSFGTVYEGISCEGYFFAVKEVSLLEQGRQSIYQLEQEIDLLSQFEHENIVRYLGTETVDSELYIFLELATQGSLAKLYQQYSLRDSHVSAYTRQILLGLKYLHDKNVVHRDIKSANILVASNGIVKLADFGLAKATRLNDLKSCKGTAFWMAPEVVNHKNEGYGLPADIWSLGCTVLEMLTGHVPYHPLDFMQALFRIWKGVPPPIPDHLSSDARDFIQQCLRVNPNDRPTAADLLEHQFLRRPLKVELKSEAAATTTNSKDGKEEEAAKSDANERNPRVPRKRRKEQVPKTTKRRKIEKEEMINRAEHGSDIRSELQFRIGYPYPKIGKFDIRIRSEKYRISDIRYPENFGSDTLDIRYPIFSKKE